MESTNEHKLKKIKESKKEQRKLTDPEDLESEPHPPSEKNSKPLRKLKNNRA